MTRALWTGSCRSRWAVPVAVLQLGFAVAAFLTPVWWVGLALVGAAALVLLFRRIEVSIDRKDLIVRYGAPWAWPQRVPRKEIRSAEVVDVRPWRWGGWGYRGSVRLFRRAAIVLRAGEALELRLRRDRRLVITVDDAAGAVAVLGR